MSYDTHYDLNWEGDSPSMEDVIYQAAELVDGAAPGTPEHKTASEEWEQMLDCSMSCRWYQHEADMARISQAWPQTVFELSGQGEDAGDVWKKYFLNGRVQRAPGVITHVAFDPGLLGEPETLR